MHKTILGAACVLLAVQVSTAQTGSKDELLKVESEFNEAKVHNDVTTLDRILAPDYIGINQWGARRDKQSALQLFSQFPTASLMPDHVSVHVSGDTATIDGIMSESSGGMQMKFFFMRTYIKREGRWLLLNMCQTFRVNPGTMTVADPTPAQ